MPMHTSSHKEPNMSNLKIKSISLPLMCEDDINPVVTLEDNSLKSIEWKDFVEHLPSFLIPSDSGFVSLKNSIVNNNSLEKLSINYTDAEFLNNFFKNTFVNLKGLVINFNEGSYLLEHSEFYKLTDGSIKNKLIRKFKGRDIKFNTNGVYGFSVWKNNVCLEDRMWSIDECEDYIEQSVKIEKGN